jgi:hypothetical protein
MLAADGPPQNRMILGTPAGRPNEARFENKFEIRFGTQRPMADSKGMADDSDIQVHNKNLDRTWLVGELSAGQFVLGRASIYRNPLWVACWSG